MSIRKTVHWNDKKGVSHIKGGQTKSERVHCTEWVRYNRLYWILHQRTDLNVITRSLWRYSYYTGLIGVQSPSFTLCEPRVNLVDVDVELYFESRKRLTIGRDGVGFSVYSFGSYSPFLYLLLNPCTLIICEWGTFRDIESQDSYSCHSYPTI